MAAASAAGLDLLQDLGRLIAGEIQPLRELVEQLVVRVGANEDALKGKADSQLHMQIAQVEQTLQGKASADEMKQLVERSLRVEQALKTKADIDVHTKVAGIEQGLQEKASSGNLQDLHQQVMAFEDTFTRKLDQSIQGLIQGQISSIQQVLDEVTSSEGLQHLSTRVVKDGLKGLESTLEEKVGRAQFMKLEDAVAEMLQQHISSVEQFHQLENSVGCVGEGLQRVDKVLLQTPTSSQIQLLEDAVEAVHDQLGHMEQAMALKASTSDIVDKFIAIDNHAQVSASDIAGRFTDLETRMQDKVAVDEMEKIDASVKGIESRLQHAEQTFSEQIGTGQLRIVVMQQELEQKADATQVHQVETSMEEMRAMHETIEAGIDAKVIAGFAQQVKEPMTSLEAKLDSLSQSLQGKVDYSCFHQSEVAAEAVLKNVETRYDGLADTLQKIEAGVEAKVTVGFSQRVQGPMTCLESKLESLSQSLQGKVDVGSFHQSEMAAEAAMKNMETQYADLADALQERALHDKGQSICLGQVEASLQELEARLQGFEVVSKEKNDMGESLASLQAKIGHVEQEQMTVVCRFLQMESSVCSLVKKLTSMQEAVQQKVGAEQLEHQSLVLDEIQQKITSIETDLSARCTADRECIPQQILAGERLEQLERSTEAELRALKKVLNEKANAQEVARLRASTQELLEPSITFTDEGYSAPVSSPKLLIRARAAKRQHAER